MLLRHEGKQVNAKRTISLHWDDLYFWALARDDRPWLGDAPPGVAFTYAPGRAGKYADDILQGFSGTLQVDGYAGYGPYKPLPRLCLFQIHHWNRNSRPHAPSPDNRTGV